MADKSGEIAEQLRQLTWEVRISRDHLLKVVEKMPSYVRERAEETVGKLMAFYTQIQELTTSLPPPEVDVPEKFTEDMGGLRRSVESALREVDSLSEELHDLLGESVEGCTQVPKIN